MIHENTLVFEIIPKKIDDTSTLDICKSMILTAVQQSLGNHIDQRIDKKTMSVEYIHVAASDLSPTEVIVDIGIEIFSYTAQPEHYSTVILNLIKDYSPESLKRFYYKQDLIAPN